MVTAAVAGLAVTVGALAGAAPAHAAVPDRYGFVLFNGAAVVPASTQPAGTTVTPLVPGRYRVLFPGQAAKGGVVHVTAVNGAPHWCQATKWEPSGTDELVYLSCHIPGGALAKTGFTAFFTSSSGPVAMAAGRYGYVDTLGTGAIVSQFNSAGAANSVGHVPGSGTYLVKLPGLGTVGPQAGSIQVTAVNPNVGRRCKVAAWASTVADQQVKVACWNSAGVLADNRFTLSFQFERALNGAAHPPKNFGYLWNRPPLGPPPANFNSVLGSGVNTLIPAGAGLSLVTFKSIGVHPDDVQVTAAGSHSEFCGLNTVWGVSGDAVVRDVNCFTNAGAPINTGFLISYNSAL